MKFYSETLKRLFETEAECKEKESLYLKEQEEKKEREKKLTDEKRARAHEVSEAYSKVREMQKTYIKLKNKFIQDYGYFHMSYRDIDDIPYVDIFDLFRF